MNRIEKPGLIYTHRPDGIHEFEFTGDSDESLDHFFDILKDLLTNTPTDQTLTYLVDARTSKGRGSMTELIKRFRKLEALIPQGQRAAGRTAIIHSGSIMLILANTFLDTLSPNKDKAHFFRETERHKAIEWLLQDE